MEVNLYISINIFDKLSCKNHSQKLATWQISIHSDATSNSIRSSTTNTIHIGQYLRAFQSPQSLRTK